MTPERAAALLEVGVEADAAVIEKAFARKARETHPDRFAGDPESARSHSEDFAEVARAREVLMARAKARAGRAASATRSVPDGSTYPRGVRPISRPLIVTWSVLLVIAGLLGSSGDDHPLTVAEPIIRWSLLAISLVAFAVTGRRWLLIAGALLIALSAVATVLFAGLGNLLGLLLLIPCAYGLSLMGLARRPPVDN